jgi:hypothetical protein
LEFFKGWYLFFFHGNVPKYFLGSFKTINNLRIDWEFGINPKPSVAGIP